MCYLPSLLRSGRIIQRSSFVCLFARCICDVKSNGKECARRYSNQGRDPIFNDAKLPSCSGVPKASNPGWQGEMRPAPLPAQPGQESVWDYPRPAVCEPETQPLRVEFGGACIADTKKGYRTLETSHPPTYYLPPADIKMQHLLPTSHTSFCEWKGRATYYDVVVGDRVAHNAAWSYPKPTAGFVALTDHVAFYPDLMDGCFVGGERATPQPGQFYGGWITSKVAGPFKGSPGSNWW